MSLTSLIFFINKTSNCHQVTAKMTAHSGGEVVKAPGNLVISVYCTCLDITKTVTPDLKLGDNGLLVHIDLAKGKRRLGGSALAQVFDQVGMTVLTLRMLKDLNKLSIAFKSCLKD